MGKRVQSKAVWRALTTINAPLPVHIDADTLLDCLFLHNQQAQWQPHMRAFFSEVHIDILMDMVVEGALNFEDFSKAIDHWSIDKDCDNARWVREMVADTVAKPHAVHA